MLARTQPSLLDLIRWLETKDPQGEYNYIRHDKCLAAQYFKSIGQNYKQPSVCKPNGTINQKIEYIAACVPSTFGAALERAKAMYEAEANA